MKELLRIVGKKWSSGSGCCLFYGIRSDSI